MKLNQEKIDELCDLCVELRKKGYNSAYLREKLKTEKLEPEIENIIIRQSDEIFLNSLQNTKRKIPVSGIERRITIIIFGLILTAWVCGYISFGIFGTVLFLLIFASFQTIMQRVRKSSSFDKKIKRKHFKIR